MVVKDKPDTMVCVDKMGVVLYASNPVNTLNKKHAVLAYPLIKEHVSNVVIEIQKNDTKDSYGGAYTNNLFSNKFHDFFYELQCN